MNQAAFPARSETRILFAHAVYVFDEFFVGPYANLRHTTARNLEAVKAAIPQADVLVTSFMWRDEFLPLAPHLPDVRGELDRAFCRSVRTRDVERHAVDGDRAGPSHAAGVCRDLDGSVRSADEQGTWIDVSRLHRRAPCQRAAR